MTLVPHMAVHTESKMTLVAATDSDWDICLHWQRGELPRTFDRTSDSGASCCESVLRCELAW